MNPAVIPVAVHGVTWTAALVGLLNLLVGGALVAVIKQWPAIKRLQNERIAAEDSSTIGGFKAVIEAQAAEIIRLGERIDRLERSLDAERGRHASEVRQINVSHEAEMSLQRHATRNAKQVLYGTLDLIEAAPENAAAHAAKMRRRMEENDRAETDEAARIRSAKIIAAGPNEAAAPIPVPETKA